MGQFVRVWLLGLLFIFLSPSQSSAFFCKDLFNSTFGIKKVGSGPPTEGRTQRQIEYELLLSTMKKIETDRYLLFSRFANVSVHDFLQKVAQVHLQQSEMISNYSFTSLSPAIFRQFRDQINSEAEHTTTRFRRMQEEFNLKNVKMSEIIKPEVYELRAIQDHVISMIVSPITIMAEMLVAIQFGGVESTEAKMPEIVPNWREMQNKGRTLSYGEKDFLKKKTMDLLSMTPEGTSIIEVKFFGRHKKYDKASGEAVFEKLTLLRKLTQNNPKVRVILAIVGPGHLANGARSRYEEAGVEVIHLTPDWYQATKN